ncbi:MAG: 2-C-methyl-D-erythritol 4-phosphate cytidylyltransferase [Actinomycetota bacterium]
MTSAIVAAGGRGERARGGTLKQFQVLGGRPLIAWSLDVMVTAGCEPIVVVVPPESIPEARSLLGDGVVVVAGGASRQESVRNGLAHVSTVNVVVHDAARPFVTPEMIERTVVSLEDAEGAIVATPLDETLKRVDGDVVADTVTRAHLWRVQTPQSFRTEVLKDAHDKAAGEGFEATDDASLVERYGGRVVVVHGARANIKLTYPEDFVIAETMIKGRAKSDHLHPREDS